MDARALTREQSRQVDQLAVEKYGVPSIVLMENAGRGTVDALLDFDPSLAVSRESTTRHGAAATVAILTGKGNNAGDGFVIARHLAIRGVSATTILLSSPTELTGDAKMNYEILAKLGEPIVDLSSSTDLAAALANHAGNAAWLVDAMLGTGAVGAPRPPLDDAIRWMNNSEAKRLAVDVPSGLDCDTGESADATVRADLTCTFVATKVGFQQPAATPYLGEVRVLDIGVPASIINHR